MSKPDDEIDEKPIESKILDPLDDEELTEHTPITELIPAPERDEKPPADRPTARAG